MSCDVVASWACRPRRPWKEGAKSLRWRRGDDNESNWTRRATCDVQAVTLGRWCDERSPDSWGLGREEWLNRGSPETQKSIKIGPLLPRYGHGQDCTTAEITAQANKASKKKNNLDDAGICISLPLPQSQCKTSPKDHHHHRHHAAPCPSPSVAGLFGPRQPHAPWRQPAHLHLTPGLVRILML